MQEPRLPEGIGWTSLMVAYARAEESRRPDRLFDDPLAREFVAAATGSSTGQAGGPPRLGPVRDDGTSVMWNLSKTLFATRTTLYDEVVVRATDSGCRQVVILAAGMDCRAYRLGLPADTLVYEIDLPEVLEFKQAVLDRSGAATAVRRVAVPADLQEDWTGALTGRGFDPALPTVWLAEGLLVYFTAAQADALLEAMTRLSARGSHLATEYLSRPVRLEDFGITDPDEVAAGRLVADAMRSGPGLPPDQWLTRHGWESQSISIVELMRKYSREIPHLFDPDRDDPITPWLISGHY